MTDIDTTPYRPQPGSVPYSVLAFFKANADEELSRADIALKYDIPRNSIDSILGLCFYHLLLRKHKVGKTDDHCVIAGPALRNYELPAAQADALAAGGKLGQRKARIGVPRPRLPDLDLSAIKVEAGVPQPTGRRPAVKGQTRYDDLFAALHTVNLSAPVPLRYMPALQKAAMSRRKNHGEHFVVRKMSETEARVWRTA